MFDDIPELPTRFMHCLLLSSDKKSMVLEHQPGYVSAMPESGNKNGRASTLREITQGMRPGYVVRSSAFAFVMDATKKVKYLLIKDVHPYRLNPGKWRNPGELLMAYQDMASAPLEFLMSVIDIQGAEWLEAFAEKAPSELGEVTICETNGRVQSKYAVRCEGANGVVEVIFPIRLDVPDVEDVQMSSKSPDLVAQLFTMKEIQALRAKGALTGFTEKVFDFVTE